MKQTQKLTTKMAFTLAERGQRPHLNLDTKENKTNFVTLKKPCPELVSGLFQGLAHGEISRQFSKDKLLLMEWQSLIGDQMLKRVQHDNKKITKNIKISNTRKKGELMFQKTKKLTTTKAFTLAETLIALAVIGIVAALTIPGIVKNYNQKAWERAQDVFSRKLDVALKEMNTEGTLTGYRTTEAFVNELKKNIKITKICTGSQLTNCFADKVVWNESEEPIEITTSSVKFAESKENAFDWAEPVGIQFVNGINAIIGYNKNCYSDPYNNQYSPSSTCIGIMYDVSGFKKPNARDKDIASNGNVALSGCAFKFSITVDGKKESVCFTKVLAPDTGYKPFPMEIDGQTVTCTKAIGKYIESEYTSCFYSTDYWAGAQYACGGKKDNMATMEQLGYLATYLYGYNGVIGPKQDVSSSEGYKLKTELLGPFHNIDGYSYFGVWSGREDNIYNAYSRYFSSDDTHYDDRSGSRHYTTRFAVCVE